MRRMLVLVLALTLCMSASYAERLPDEVLLTCFDGNVFVGDSITGNLRSYVARLREKSPDLLKGTVFYYADNYKLHAAAKDSINTTSESNLRYRGTEMPMCQIIGLRQPPRVLILLGVNDYIGTQIDNGMRYVDRIIDLLEKYAPDTEIVFFSLTPVTARFCRIHHEDYQPMWDQYNESLRTRAEEMGAFFIDIATPLKDEHGFLDPKLSSDNEFHLNNAGNAIWLSCLCDYAQMLYEEGRWTPDLAEGDDTD